MRFPKKIALAAGVISTAALLASGTVMAAGLSACPTDESTLDYIFSQIQTASPDDKGCMPATNPSGNGTLLASGGYVGTVLVDADNNAIALPHDGSGQTCGVQIGNFGGWHGSLLLYGAKAAKFMVQNLKSNIESLQLTQSDVYVGPNYKGGAGDNGLQGRLCTYKLAKTPYVYQLVYFPQNPNSGLYQPAGKVEKGKSVAGDGVQLPDQVTALTANNITVFNRDNQLDSNNNVHSTTVNLHYKDPNDALCPSGYGAYVVRAAITYSANAAPSSTEIDSAVNDMLNGKLGFCQPSSTVWSVAAGLDIAYCQQQSVSADKVDNIIYGWNCVRTQGEMPMTQGSQLLRK